MSLLSSISDILPDTCNLGYILKVPEQFYSIDDLCYGLAFVPLKIVTIGDVATEYYAGYSPLFHKAGCRWRLTVSYRDDGLHFTNLEEGRELPC